MGIKAGDLTPGWYTAHGSGKRDCYVELVTPLDLYTVQITYAYCGSRYTQTYSKGRDWNVKPFFSEYVIEELGVLS